MPISTSAVATERTCVNRLGQLLDSLRVPAYFTKGELQMVFVLM